MINKIIYRIGEAVSFLNVLLIVIIIVDVLLRYFFATSKNWVLELEWHVFALIFLLGAAYTMQKDEHVRVDLFYQGYSSRKKMIVDTIGHIFFLIPWSIIIISTSYNYALNSFLIKEGSPNPGGLPYRYIIKGAILLAFGLILMQTIQAVLTNIRKIL